MKINWKLLLKIYLIGAIPIFLFVTYLMFTLTCSKGGSFNMCQEYGIIGAAIWGLVVGGLWPFLLLILISTLLIIMIGGLF